jgi:hypothetical protein
LAGLNISVHSFSVPLELLVPLLLEDDELPLLTELLEPLFSLLLEDDELPLLTELLEPLFSLLLEEEFSMISGGGELFSLLSPEQENVSAIATARTAVNIVWA